MFTLYDLGVNIFPLQEYFKLRLRAVEKLKAENDNPYPHKYHVGMSLVEYIDRYNSLEAGHIDEATTVSVAGTPI